MGESHAHIDPSTLRQQLEHGDCCLLRGESGDDLCVVWFVHRNRVLRLTLSNGAIAEHQWVNPYAMVQDDDGLDFRVSMLARGSHMGLRVAPLPAIVASSLPQLDRALARPRDQVLDDLLGWIRGGHPIGGGPTTDQRWSIFWEPSEGVFVRQSTKPYDPSDETAVVVREQVDEEEVREVLSTMHAFGLYRLEAEK